MWQLEIHWIKLVAYGIQTMGGLFVQSIQGDYNNVIGLPISRLFKALLSLRLIEIERGCNS